MQHLHHFPRNAETSNRGNYYTLLPRNRHRATGIYSTYKDKVNRFNGNYILSYTTKRFHACCRLHVPPIICSVSCLASAWRQSETRLRKKTKGHLWMKSKKGEIDKGSQRMQLRVTTSPFPPLADATAYELSPTRPSRNSRWGELSEPMRSAMQSIIGFAATVQAPRIASYAQIGQSGTFSSSLYFMTPYHVRPVCDF